MTKTRNWHRAGERNGGAETIRRWFPHESHMMKHFRSAATGSLSSGGRASNTNLILNNPLKILIEQTIAGGKHVTFSGSFVNRPRSIYQFSNMAPRLSGKRYRFLNFFCLLIPKRDLATKKTLPNIEICPKSLGAVLEYWDIERGLFSFRVPFLLFRIITFNFYKCQITSTPIPEHRF